MAEGARIPVMGNLLTCTALVCALAFSSRAGAQALAPFSGLPIGKLGASAHVNTSRDGRAVWVGLEPVSSSVRLPHGTTAIRYPADGGSPDPLLALHCRSAGPAARPLIAELLVRLHPAAPDTAGPFSDPLTWLALGLAGREEEHTPVRVGFGPHSHASALVRKLTDYSIPRPVQSIELDGRRLLGALRSSAGPLSVAVVGPGVKINGEYDVGGLGQLVARLAQHCP